MVEAALALMAIELIAGARPRACQPPGPSAVPDGPVASGAGSLSAPAGNRGRRRPASCASPAPPPGRVNLHGAGGGSKYLLGLVEWLAGAEEAFEQARLAGPGFQQHLAGHLPSGVAQREGDDHDVVEWADDG